MLIEKRQSGEKEGGLEPEKMRLFLHLQYSPALLTVCVRVRACVCVSL